MIIGHNDALSTAGPHARHLYGLLLEALKSIGPFEVEVKRTSIHLVRRSAFVGVQLLKAHLILTIKSDGNLKGSRIMRTDQVSRNRWHSELRLASEAEVDQELLTWIKTAYQLCE